MPAATQAAPKAEARPVLIDAKRAREIAAQIRLGKIALPALTGPERNLVAHALDQLSDDLIEAALPDRLRRKQKGREA